MPVTGSPLAKTAPVPAHSKTTTAPSPARWLRPWLVYALIGVIGVAAFLYPFWLPSEALPSSAHSTDAPLVSAAIGLVVVAGILLEARRGTMNGATIAFLGILSSVAGLLRLVDLPGGGSGMFFFVILASAAYGPRFGLLLGMVSMATSASLTGGIGPWLPYQMLAQGLMGVSTGALGLLTRKLPPRLEIVALAGWGWIWGFLYGAVMNLWFWPFVRDLGPLSWQPGMDLSATLRSYWAFYVATSLAWDAAGAASNVLLITLTGLPILKTLRRYGVRIAPEPTLSGPDSTPSPRDAPA